MRFFNKISRLLQEEFDRDFWAYYNSLSDDDKDSADQDAEGEEEEAAEEADDEEEDDEEDDEEYNSDETSEGTGDETSADTSEEETDEEADITIDLTTEDDEQELFPYEVRDVISSTKRVMNFDTYSNSKRRKLWILCPCCAFNTVLLC